MTRTAQLRQNLNSVFYVLRFADGLPVDDNNGVRTDNKPNFEIRRNGFACTVSDSSTWLGRI